MVCKTLDKNKLSGEQKYFVVHRLAEGFTSKQIARMVQEQYSIDVTAAAIRVYRQTKKWKAKIAEIEAGLYSNVFSIPIANKHTRLAYLQDLYLRAMAGYSKDVVTKDGSVVTVREIDYDLARRAIREAREEIGEKESKLADALRESGSKTTVVNNIVGIGGDLPNDERERITRELAIAEGFIELPRGNIRN